MGLGSDPVTDAIASAKEKLSEAGLMSLLLLGGIAYLVFRSRR